MIIRSLLTISIVGFSAMITSCLTNAEGLTVSDPWARQGIVGENTAIYFIISGGDSADALIAASSDTAEEVMIHKSVMADDGTMHMEHQMSVSIPPNEIVAFEPGGLHIMLLGLNRDLSEDDRIVLTLTFENIGEVRIDAPVKSP